MPDQQMTADEERWLTLVQQARAAIVPNEVLDLPAQGFVEACRENREVLWPTAYALADRFAKASGTANPLGLHVMDPKRRKINSLVDPWLWFEEGEPVAVLVTTFAPPWRYWEMTGEQAEGLDLAWPHNNAPCVQEAHGAGPRILGVYVDRGWRQRGIARKLAITAAEVMGFKATDYIHTWPFSPEGLSFALSLANGSVLRVVR